MDRTFFLPNALEVAPRLLGAEIEAHSEQGTVRLRITETEAYLGLGSSETYDPGSHSKDKRTERNASMFGEPGHAYVYFSYGMHHALNLVCSPAGQASGVLIRAGEITAGHQLARQRRLAARKSGAAELADWQLARGPGNVATALGLSRQAHDGADLFDALFTLDEANPRPAQIKSGPRVGVSGVAGGPQFPWRFYLPGERSVSAFRPGRGAPRA